MEQIGEDSLRQEARPRGFSGQLILAIEFINSKGTSVLEEEVKEFFEMNNLTAEQAVVVVEDLCTRGWIQRTEGGGVEITGEGDHHVPTKVIARIATARTRSRENDVA